MLDTQVLFLPVEGIAPNPCQPRRAFDPQPLAELADSIRRHGILQPLTVRQTAEGWELVAGERRLRAAKLAGLETVPCIRIQAEEQESAKVYSAPSVRMLSVPSSRERVTAPAL